MYDPSSADMQVETDGAAPPLPAKKACTECRQQKAKCDSHLQPDHRCSRCRRLSVDCVFSASFKRQPKRERVAELEQEAEALRKKLRDSMPTEVPSGFGLPQPPNPIVQPTRNSLVSQEPPTSTGVLTVGQLLSHPNPNHALVPPVPDEHTVARTLNEVLVTAREIDDMFQIFFHRYHSHLSILDPQTTPNAYYSHSEFLFWAIIGVTCQAYPNNPSFLSKLPKPITNLALVSINTTAEPIYALQGMLLLLTWPFPRDKSRLDTTFILSGILIQRAKQIGLHQPKASSEFCFVKDRNIRLSDAEMMLRSDLWARCCLVYQRTCFYRGQNPHLSNDAVQSPAFQDVDPALRLQLKCQNIVAQCCDAFVEIGTEATSSDQRRALDLLFNVYEQQLKDLEADHISTTGTLSIECRAMNNLVILVSLLTVQVFHFYSHTDVTFDGPLSRLLSTSCTVISLISNLLQTTTFPPSPPVFVVYALMQSTFSLLRIIKSPVSGGVDLDRAASHLSLGIGLVKQPAMHNNYASARMGVVLTQLWSSPNVLRRDDGSEDLGVKARKRLMLGPVLDFIWRYYDLVDEQHKRPGEARRDVLEDRNEQGSSRVQADALGDPVATQAVGSSNMSLQQQQGIFDDQCFADFDWALGDEFFAL